MKRLLTLTILLLIGWNTAAQDEDNPSPQLSKDPLTAEQAAIYRTLLSQYVQGDLNAALNIADRTDPAGLNDDPSGVDISCSPGLKLEPIPRPRVIHRLTRDIALGPNMVLVDPRRQGELVKQNDPQNLMHRAIDDHQPVSDQQLDNSVKQAFASGLFTFTEIVFDKSHRHAILAYSFWCGSLCGHGNTVVMKKSGGKWRVQKECGGWIS